MRWMTRRGADSSLISESFRRRAPFRATRRFIDDLYGTGFVDFRGDFWDLFNKTVAKLLLTASRWQEVANVLAHLYSERGTGPSPMVLQPPLAPKQLCSFTTVPWAMLMGKAKHRVSDHGILPVRGPASWM